MALELTHVHFAVLKAIPRAPKRISRTDLWQLASREAGEEIERRSMDRMMLSLTSNWPIQTFRSSKPYQYCWKEKAEQYELPSMSSLEALTVVIASEYLSQVLPPESRRLLQPRLQRAQAVLAQASNTRVPKWEKKILVVPRGLALQPPQVPREILDTVHSGLLDEVRLTVTYDSRSGGRRWVRTINPLGLISRTAQLYLVVSSPERPEPYSLALHRIKACVATTEQTTAPPGFELKQYVAQGNPSLVRSKTPLRLRLWIASPVVQSFQELSLGPDQSLTLREDGSAELRVTLPDNLDTLAFLKGYGSLITVLEPLSLARELLDDSKAFVRRQAAVLKSRGK